MTVKIEFLKEYREKIERLTDELLTMKDKYDVVVDIEEAEKFIEAIDALRIVLETTELA